MTPACRFAGSHDASCTRRGRGRASSRFNATDPFRLLGIEKGASWPELLQLRRNGLTLPTGDEIRQAVAEKSKDKLAALAKQIDAALQHVSDMGAAWRSNLFAGHPQEQEIMPAMRQALDEATAPTSCARTTES